MRICTHSCVYTHPRVLPTRCTHRRCMAGLRSATLRPWLRQPACCCMHMCKPQNSKVLWPCKTYNIYFYSACKWAQIMRLGAIGCNLCWKPEQIARRHIGNPSNPGLSAAGPASHPDLLRLNPLTPPETDSFTHESAVLAPDLHRKVF